MRVQRNGFATQEYGQRVIAGPGTVINLSAGQAMKDVTDQNGHFVFRGIPPGGYRVYSWEAIEPNAWYDPDVLTRNEPLGKPVRIQEMSRETVDVKIIPAPKQ